MVSPCGSARKSGRSGRWRGDGGSLRPARRAPGLPFLHPVRLAILGGMGQSVGILLIAVLLVVIVAVAVTRSRGQLSPPHDFDPPMRRSDTPGTRQKVDHLIPGPDDEPLAAKDMPVAGIDIGDRQKVIADLREGEPIVWVREKDNPHDENAIALYRTNGQQIGFVPKERAAEFASRLDRGSPITSTIAHTEPFIAEPSGKEMIGVRLTVVPHKLKRKKKQ